jgi:nicotinamide mononucleotide transporter
MPFDLSQLPADLVAAVRHTSPLETGAVLTTVACVWLAARNAIWNFPVAIVACILYFILLLQEKIYSDAGLQLAFIALSVYGWWSWLRRGKAGAAAAAPLPITRTSGRLWGLLAGFGVAYAAGVGYLLARYTDATVPYYDSSTTAVSLVAQYLLSRRKLENWPLWIGVDVVYVGIYWHRDLVLSSLLYAVLTGLALYGYRAWLQEANAQGPATPAPPAPAV